MQKKQTSKTFNYQSSECETEDEYDEETGVNKNKHLKSFRYFVTCSCHGDIEKIKSQFLQLMNLTEPRRALQPKGTQ